MKTPARRLGYAMFVLNVSDFILPSLLDDAHKRRIQAEVFEGSHGSRAHQSQTP